MPCKAVISFQSTEARSFKVYKRVKCCVLLILGCIVSCAPCCCLLLGLCPTACSDILEYSSKILSSNKQNVAKLLAANLRCLAPLIEVRSGAGTLQFVAEMAEILQALRSCSFDSRKVSVLKTAQKFCHV